MNQVQALRVIVGFPVLGACADQQTIHQTKDGRSGMLGATDYCDATDARFIAVEARSGTASAPSP